VCRASIFISARRALGTFHHPIYTAPQVKFASFAHSTEVRDNWLSGKRRRAASAIARA
jgi:hypothetical protein